MEFNLKKWVQIINYLAELEKEKNKKPSIDKLKVLKLVWIADRLHLRKYWSPIVWDTYFAMKFWPVASWIKNICELNNSYLNNKAIKYIGSYLQKFSHKVRTKNKTDLSQFSDTNLEVINEVFEKFWNNDSFKLVDFTHNYPEWTKFKEKLESWEIIQANMDYLDFFKNTTSQDNIFDIDNEHLEFSKDIFKENYNFSKLFA